MAIPAELTVSDGNIDPRAWVGFWSETLRLPEPATGEALAAWREVVRAALAMTEALAVAVSVGATQKGQTIIAAQANALASAINPVRNQAATLEDTSALYQVAVVPLLYGQAGHSAGWLYRSSVLYSDFIASMIPQDRTGVMAAVQGAWESYVERVIANYTWAAKALVKVAETAKDIAVSAAGGIGLGVVLVLGVVLYAKGRR